MNGEFMDYEIKKLNKINNITLVICCFNLFILYKQSCGKLRVVAGSWFSTTRNKITINIKHLDYLRVVAAKFPNLIRIRGSVARLGIPKLAILQIAGEIKPVFLPQLSANYVFVNYFKWLTLRVVGFQLPANLPHYPQLSAKPENQTRNIVVKYTTNSFDKKQQ